MSRPAYFLADLKTINPEWTECYQFVVEHPKYGVHRYVPTPKQLDFHESVIPNCIIEGSRGTGKSLCIRNDAHMRALAYPGFSYLIVRRTMPELKKSHLKAHLLPAEMLKFGGKYHKTDYVATYDNGSQGFFSHCETEDDMMKLLSSEYDAIYFDEISTFTWGMITKITSCLRVRENSGLIALVRGGTNPIGVGASDVRKYYITKDVDPEDDPEYIAEEFHAIHTTLDDNPHIDRAQYIKTLSRLPEHIRRAWLDGEWIVEGAYFHDFKPSRKVKADDELLRSLRFGIGQTVGWHVVDDYPVVKNRAKVRLNWWGSTEGEVERFQWIQIYRALDWGFSPDPAVCLWIAVLPNGRAFVFKEKHWYATPARVVAQEIVKASDGMRVVDTYCDPSMFVGSEATENTSIGDIFESNGVMLTKSINDRAAAGFAIHEYLNNVLEDGFPQVQIYLYGCPKLIRTIPEMRVNDKHPERIADSPNDHWTITLAYFCQGIIGNSREPSQSRLKPWQRPLPSKKRRLGRESVRRS